jgi:hypothetical protein
MIHVTLHADGRGIVGLPGGTVPVAADTLAAAREQAIGVLTGHAAVQALSLEVEAIDDGAAVRFSVHPDGRVIVHRTGPGARAPEPVGPSQVPAPMAPPEAYIPASSDTLAAPIDVDPTPPPLPVMPSPEEQVAIATAAADPTPTAGAATPALPEDLDMTVVRRRRAKPEAVLEFTTGETVTVSGTALVGRRPSVDDGDDIDQVVTIDDPDRSVSKSHFTAGWDDGEFWIMDRDSGNGTTVYHANGQTSVRLNPGAAHTLDDGDRVAIGDQAFTVHLKPPARN